MSELLSYDLGHWEVPMRLRMLALAVPALVASACGSSDVGTPATHPPSGPGEQALPSPAADTPGPDRASGGESETEPPEALVGVEVGPPMTGHTGAITELRFAVLDGEPVAVSSGRDGGLRVWNLRTREQIGERIDTDSTVRSLSVGELDGKPIAATVGVNATDANVHSLTTGEEIYSGSSITFHPAAVAIANVSDGPILAITSRTSVRFVDLASGDQVGADIRGHNHRIHGTTVAEINGEVVVLTAADDQHLAVWDPAAQQLIGEPVKTWHSDWVRAVAAGEMGGVPVAVTGSFDTDLRLFDLAAQQQIGDPMVGHTDAVVSVDVGEVNGVPIAISGSRDSTVRLWNLSTMQQIGDPFINHLGQVSAVALGEIDGQPVALSGGEHGAVQVWDLSEISEAS